MKEYPILSYLEGGEIVRCSRAKAEAYPLFPEAREIVRYSRAKAEAYYPLFPEGGEIVRCSRAKAEGLEHKLNHFCHLIGGIGCLIYPSIVTWFPI